MREVFLLVLGAMMLVSRASLGQSLGECLALARAHAPALAVSEAEVSRAQEAIREARAALAPTLRLDASYLQYSEAPQAVFRIPGGSSSQRIKLGSAGTLGIQTQAQITLYSGGRDRALIRAAEAAYGGERRNGEGTDADLVLRVSQAFYRAIAAERLTAAASDALASARAHLRTSAARVRAGVSARLDSLRAEVDLSSRTTALLRAKEAVEITRADLEAEIGAPLDSTAVLASPGPPALDIPEVAQAIETALRSRPELARLDEGMLETDERIQAARAESRPRVNLSATAAYSGPNQDDRFLEFSSPGLNTYKLYAALGLTLPILDGGLRAARVSQFEAEHRSQDARRRNEALLVRREVENAISDLRVALAVWQSAAGRVGAAAEALRLAEAGYKDGASTATDVRDAETALADARAEEAQSLMETWSARAALEHATGAAPTRKEP